MNTQAKDIIKTEEEKPSVGMFKDIPNDEYHKSLGISKSGLDLISRSPAHYIEVKNNPKPETDTFAIGSAFHCLVLEPEKFDSLYVKSKYPAYRSAEAKEWKAEQIASGKTVLTTVGSHWKPSQWDLVHYMNDSVRKNPYCAAILQNGIPEFTGYWIDDQGDEDLGYDPTYRLCKFRMDWWDEAHNLQFDLKSTIDASYSEFAKSCAKYRYFVQSNWYRAGAFACGLKPKAFIFCAVEKEPPYAVGLYCLDNDYRLNQLGRDLMRRDLLTYHDCMSKKEWPCYPSEIRDLELPGYVYFQKRS